MPRIRLFHVAGPPVAAAVMTLAVASLAASARADTPEHYTAAAINTNNGSAGNVEITVDRWSTGAQRDALMSVLQEKGPDQLLDALKDMPAVGHFGTPGHLSWDIHFAWKVKNPDGGERVVLVTDRRINFWEATRQPPSIDYPFTVIELRLNKNGDGEGKMSNATKIVIDKAQDIVTLENYELQPVQLSQVKRQD